MLPLSQTGYPRLYLPTYGPGSHGVWWDGRIYQLHRSFDPERSDRYRSGYQQEEAVNEDGLNSLSLSGMCAPHFRVWCQCLYIKERS